MCSVHLHDLSHTPALDLLLFKVASLPATVFSPQRPLLLCHSVSSAPRAAYLPSAPACRYPTQKCGKTTYSGCRSCWMRRGAKHTFRGTSFFQAVLALTLVSRSTIVLSLDAHEKDDSEQQHQQNDSFKGWFLDRHFSRYLLRSTTMFRLRLHLPICIRRKHQPG